MRFVNLTPHAIVVRTEEGDTVFPPSGEVARVSTREVEAPAVGGFPVVTSVFGDVTGIPAVEAGTMYIVSALVGERAARADVVAPNTGATAIRENGNVVAVRGFRAFVVA